MLAKVVLPGLTLTIFLLVMLFSKNPRRDYLFFVLYGLPFMDFSITSGEYGSFRTFDAITLIAITVSIQRLSFTGYKREPYALLTVIFLAVCFLGAISSWFITNSLMTLAAMLPIFMFAKLLLDELSGNDSFLDEILLSIKIVAVASLAFLALQLQFGLSFTWYPALNPNTIVKEGLRLPSFFHDPQKYAQYLAMVSFLFLLPKGDITIKGTISFLALVAALLLTGGRSALIGLSGGTLVVMLLGSRRTKLTLAACVVVATAAFLSFSEKFVTLNRVSQFEGDYEFRASIWRDAWEIFSQNPALGIGIGNYQNYVSHHALNQFFIYDNEVEYFDQPENGYLKLLTELGGPGFIIFILMLILPVVNYIRLLIERPPDPRYYAILGGLFAWIIAFNSVYSLADKRIAILATVFVSLIISAGRPAKSISYADKDN